MKNLNNFNVNNILNNDLLEKIENFIDPNEVLTIQNVKIIKDNIENTQINQCDQKLILDLIEKHKNNFFDGSSNFKINEKNLELFTYIRNIRNECQWNYYSNLIEHNFFYMNKYIKNFYRSFENIRGDAFMEIESLINQIEYIKHFRLKDVFLDDSVLNSNYHKNYKDIIYIYSCFDKIASLFYMFNKSKFDTKNNNLEKYIYFSKDMSKNNYFENKTLIEKSDFFIKSKLFKDFKKLRNEITHKYTYPMDNYFTNLYSFVGLFLLTYYVKEILY